MFQKICIFAAAIILLMSACSKPEKPESVSTQEQDSIHKERTERDAFFMSDSSPLLPPDKQEFHGLHYYPVDPSMKFSVRLQRYQAPAHVRLGTNTGEIRNGLRYGYFNFRVGGQDCRLQVYRLEEALESGSPALFIPFRDATTGHETYGAGRYLDLKENTSGVYDLDFNLAYNPSCAYNSQFSCPVPPAENTLKVPIRAGEKKYH
jgi:uncharacterized protein (DUF1684 family)